MPLKLINKSNLLFILVTLFVGLSNAFAGNGGSGGKGKGGANGGGGDPRAIEAVKYGKQVVAWLLTNRHPDIAVSENQLMSDLETMERSLDTFAPLIRVLQVNQLDDCFGMKKTGCTRSDSSIDIAGNYWDHTSKKSKCTLFAMELFVPYITEKRYDKAELVCNAIYPEPKPAQSPEVIVNQFRCNSTCRIAKCQMTMQTNIFTGLIGWSFCDWKEVSNNTISSEGSTPQEAFDNLYNKCPFVNNPDLNQVILIGANGGPVFNSGETEKIPKLCYKVSAEMPEMSKAPEDPRDKIPHEDPSVCAAKSLRHSFMGQDYIREEWDFKREALAVVSDIQNYAAYAANNAKLDEQFEHPGAICGNLNSQKIGSRTYLVRGDCVRNIRVKDFRGKLCL